MARTTFTFQVGTGNDAHGYQVSAPDSGHIGFVHENRGFWCARHRRDEGDPENRRTSAVPGFKSRQFAAEFLHQYDPPRWNGRS